MNKHSRKYDGFVNDKAIGIQPAEKNSVTLITKTDSIAKPSESLDMKRLGGSNRK